MTRLDESSAWWLFVSTLLCMEGVWEIVPKRFLVGAFSDTFGYGNGLRSGTFGGNSNSSVGRFCCTVHHNTNGFLV